MIPTHNSVFTFMFLSTLVIFSRFSSTCLFSCLELSLCYDSGAMCSGSVKWCMWREIRNKDFTGGGDYLTNSVKMSFIMSALDNKGHRRRKFSHFFFLFLFRKVCERFRSTMHRELSCIAEKVPFFFFYRWVFFWHSRFSRRVTVTRDRHNGNEMTQDSWIRQVFTERDDIWLEDFLQTLRPSSSFPFSISDLLFCIRWNVTAGVTAGLDSCCPDAGWSQGSLFPLICFYLLAFYMTPLNRGTVDVLYMFRMTMFFSDTLRSRPASAHTYEGQYDGLWVIILVRYRLKKYITLTPVVALLLWTGSCNTPSDRMGSITPLKSDF